MVDKPLTVYEPGFSASPNTNTRMERKSPMLMLTRVPINCRPTRSSIAERASAKVNPPMTIGPSFGNRIRPSRSTVSLYLDGSLP